MFEIDRQGQPLIFHFTGDAVMKRCKRKHDPNRVPSQHTGEVARVCVRTASVPTKATNAVACAAISASGRSASSFHANGTSGGAAPSTNRPFGNGIVACSVSITSSSSTALPPL